MAIPSGAAVFFKSGQVTLTSGTSSIVHDASPVAASGGTAYANPDNAPMAQFVLEFTLAVAPAAGKLISLLARPLNVQSTNDAEAPTSTFKRKHIGWFDVRETTSKQYCAIEAGIPIGDLEFYIDNQSGQTMSAGWHLYVDLMAVGAKA